MPPTFTEVHKIHDAHIVVATLLKNANEPTRRWCDVTANYVNVLGSDVMISMVGGKRMVHKSYFDVVAGSDARPASIKFKEVFKVKKWGIHLVDGFKSKHKAIATWLEGFCTTHCADSKFISLPKHDYDTWMKNKTNKRRCSMISNLEALDVFVRQILVIDTLHSVTYVDQVPARH